jgi:structural maintenance of chromosome 1
VKECRDRLVEYDKTLAEMHRGTTGFESQLDQLRAKRHDFLKKCKVEEIELPLVSGSLDTLGGGEMEEAGDDASVSMPASSVAVGSMDTEVAKGIREREEEIVLDFTGLHEELLNLDSTDEIADVDSQFKEKLQEIVGKIESMRPNLSASKRLEGVADRLQESKDEFDTIQAGSRSAAAKFAAVQRKRKGLFNAAFEHIQQQIVPIYKQLTHSKKAQGGTAFLGLENGDEPYLVGGDISQSRPFCAPSTIASFWTCESVPRICFLLAVQKASMF